LLKSREKDKSAWKRSKLSGGTHFLESIEGGTYQHIERKQLLRGTHKLESVKEGTNQRTEWKQVIEGYLQTKSEGRD
jgi:hypothetical protein